MQLRNSAAANGWAQKRRAQMERAAHLRSERQKILATSPTPPHQHTNGQDANNNLHHDSDDYTAQSERGAARTHYATVNGVNSPANTPPAAIEYGRRAAHHAASSAMPSYAAPPHLDLPNDVGSLPDWARDFDAPRHQHPTTGPDPAAAVVAAAALKPAGRACGGAARATSASSSWDWFRESEPPPKMRVSAAAAAAERDSEPHRSSDLRQDARHHLDLGQAERDLDAMIRRTNAFSLGRPGDVPPHVPPPMAPPAKD